MSKISPEHLARSAYVYVRQSAVNPLRQKGLDNLRGHYRHLLKIGYKTEWTLEQRSAERERLERFFRSIGKPL